MILSKIRKIFFVGLGGAGQRHARIFRELLPAYVEFSAFRTTNKTPLLHSDFSVNKNSTIDEQYDLKVFDSLASGFDNSPDVVVISTPSALHYEIAKSAASNRINIFVEKPFSHNLDHFDELCRLVKDNDLIFFISYQRRFHPFMMKIKNIIESGDLGKIITANFDVASYVPSWHPYEDHRQLYACRSDLGGGVLLTEIHEIDLCYWFFGFPDRVSCTGGNYSETILDVEDTAHVTLDYTHYSVQVNLCFMQKQTRRNIVITGTKGCVEWNQEGNVLKSTYYDDGRNTIESDPNYRNNDMFLAQAKYFLNGLRVEDNAYCLKVAEASLAIVGAAKESMNSDKKVSLTDYQWKAS